MAKRQRPHKTGCLFKRDEHGPWVARWRDAKGKRPEQSTGTTDKAAAERILAKRVADAALRRDGVVDARMDAYAAADRKPLAEHVGEWKAALAAKGTTGHAELSASRVLRIIDGCKLERITGIAASVIETYLKDLRTPKPKAEKLTERRGLSAASSNHYLRAFKGFCRWLVRDGRARHNPVAHVALLNEKTDRRHERRALSAAELSRLIEAARTGPSWRGIGGADRAALYRTAAETGLRLSELASLAVESFDLSANPPTVTVKAAYSKHRRDDTLPIRGELAGALAEHFKGKLPAAQAFNVPPRQHAAAMFRADLERVGIAYRDDADRVADFHSLRHTFISNLARGGVHPKVAQALARHSTITLTMDRYSHTVVGELADALDALPDLEHEAQEAAVATGTDGRKARPYPRPNQRQLGDGSGHLDATRCDGHNLETVASGARKRLRAANVSEEKRALAARDDNRPRTQVDQGDGLQIRYSSVRIRPRPVGVLGSQVLPFPEFVVHRRPHVFRITKNS